MDSESVELFISCLWKGWSLTVAILTEREIAVIDRCDKRKADKEEWNKRVTKVKSRGRLAVKQMRKSYI